MKTLERSARRLRLTHFGWYYGAIAAAFGALCLYAAVNLWMDGNLRDAAIFAGLGAGGSLVLGLVATRKFTVTLDRTTGVVHVRNTTATGTRVRAAPLTSLKTAHLQTTNTGDLQLYRLILQFHDRDAWVVTRMYTSGDGTIHAVETINTWIRQYLSTSDLEHENHHEHA